MRLAISLLVERSERRVKVRVRWPSAGRPPKGAWSSARPVRAAAARSRAVARWRATVLTRRAIVPRPAAGLMPFVVTTKLPGSNFRTPTGDARMGLMDGKKGLILNIANDRSIATHI